MKYGYWIFPVIISVLLFSCGKKQEQQNDKDAIAIVNGEYLYKADIIKLLPKRISSEDSAKFVSSYVNSWVSEKVMFAQAKDVLTDTTVIEEKIKQYRQQLYLYYYTEHFVYNDIDYKIAEKEIEDYYNNNLQDYVLAKTYVKAHYMTMHSDVYTYYLERDKLFNSEASDVKELQDFCIGTGRKVYFVEEWTELGDFLQEIKFYNNFDSNELIFKSTFEHINGNLRYLIKYDDYKTIGDYMPYEIAKNDIIEIIINKRKRDKLIQTQKRLIDKGLNSGSVIIN